MVFLVVVVVLVVVKMGCLVRFCLNRDDDMIMIGKWYDFEVVYDVVFEDSGWFLVVDIVFFLCCGCLVDFFFVVNDWVMFYLDNVYYIFDVCIIFYWFKINMVFNMVFRGFGGL